MTLTQYNYISHIEGLNNTSASAASANRILTNNPEPGIEMDVNAEWNNQQDDMSKKLYEDEIVGAIIDGTVIPEHEHPIYETEFDIQGVLFTNSESLSDLCKRKKRPA